MKYLFKTCDTTVYVQKTLFGKKFVFRRFGGRGIILSSKEVKKIIKEWSREMADVGGPDGCRRYFAIATWPTYFYPDRIEVGCNTYTLPMIVEILTQL